MFTAILLVLASASGAPAEGPITIVNEQPTIQIPLAGYDLSRPDEVRRVERAIGHAADKVCASSYRDAIYLEIVACVKSAAVDARAQLGAILARRSTSASMTAAIAVSAPSN